MPIPPFSLCCLTSGHTVGTRSEETSDCDVFTDSQWHGVPHPKELCPQRSSYKKLHVGYLSIIMTYLLFCDIPECGWWGVPYFEECSLCELHMPYIFLLYRRRGNKVFILNLSELMKLYHRRAIKNFSGGVCPMLCMFTFHSVPHGNWSLKL